MKTAILVDAEFYIRNLERLKGQVSPQDAASLLEDMAWLHALTLHHEQRQIYRIFVYDCRPLTKRVHYPRSGRILNFSKTPTFEWRTAFHVELLKLRKVALRMGVLNDQFGRWSLRPRALDDLLHARRTFEELTDNDFYYEVKQKGVDMKIGLDIASIAVKKLADQIVLVAGDSDFVPAAKAARREGVDFVVDSMGAPVASDLFEHIDGVVTATVDQWGAISEGSDDA